MENNIGRRTVVHLQRKTGETTFKMGFGFKYEFRTRTSPFEDGLIIITHNGQRGVVCFDNEVNKS